MTWYWWIHWFWITSLSTSTIRCSPISSVDTTIPMKLFNQQSKVYSKREPLKFPIPVQTDIDDIFDGREKLLSSDQQSLRDELFNNAIKFNKLEKLIDKINQTTVLPLVTTSTTMSTTLNTTVDVPISDNLLSVTSSTINSRVVDNQKSPTESSKTVQPLINVNNKSDYISPITTTTTTIATTTLTTDDDISNQTLTIIPSTSMINNTNHQMNKMINNNKLIKFNNNSNTDDDDNSGGGDDDDDLPVSNSTRIDDVGNFDRIGRMPKILDNYKELKIVNFSAESKNLLARLATVSSNEDNLTSEALSIKRAGVFDAGTISGICVVVIGVICSVSVLSVVLYRRRYINKPQTLSEPDSSGYLDDSTIKDNSDEMYSLDNDSFLNSLEAMTIQNYWTDNVKHTKL